MSEQNIESLSGIRMNMIHPGKFMMGSPATEEGRDDDESLHEVTISRTFWIGQHPVTQGQYRVVMGRNPSKFCEGGDQLPVESVSFFDIIDFCEKLTLLDQQKKRILPNQRYRLPTEAEWEYACRAGSSSAVYTGPIRLLGDNNCPELEHIAWYGGNSAANYRGAHSVEVNVRRFGPLVFWSKWRDKAHDHSSAGPQPVGKLRPNAWGLYDMLGNVKEWCLDWYELYEPGPATNPTGPQSGQKKVVRGGAWNCVAHWCRCAFRSSDDPRGKHGDLGFRLALS